MPKKPPQAEATESFGSDSFLDVVANMVGILIILVMVAGLRVKQAAAEPEQAAAAAPVEDLSPLEREAKVLEADVHAVFNQAKQLTDLASRRMEERDALALVAAAKKKELEDRQLKLASAEREAFDLQRTAESERIKLAGLERDLAAAELQPDRESIKIKTYPTPLSRTVYGRESHFQIKNNRIVYVPLEELIDMVKREVESKAYRVRDLDEFTETVGPIGGFRLRYTIAKIKQPPRNGMPGGVFIGVTQLTCLPMQPDLGETLEAASQPHSDLQRALADLDPRRVTITFWTYPESFGMYRTLREELYKRGYAVAGRPLPTGQPISGSPFGSKSSAQ